MIKFIHLWAFQLYDLSRLPSIHIWIRENINCDNHINGCHNKWLSQSLNIKWIESYFQSINENVTNFFFF